MIYVTSFGYRNGVPPDSDLVFDVRFLPNPNYIPRFKNLTGKNPPWRAISGRSRRPLEFISRISDLLIYLLPHYIREGKSYLTIAFGCTGGQHRSVMIADQIRKQSGEGRLQSPRSVTATSCAPTARCWSVPRATGRGRHHPSCRRTPCGHPAAAPTWPPRGSSSSWHGSPGR